MPARAKRRKSSTGRLKISAVDTAWLRMDRPQNLMMITGVLLFGERIALPRLRKVIHERFTTERVDDVRRNVLSILQRLFPETRLPAHLDILVCREEAGPQVV